MFFVHHVGSKTDTDVRGWLQLSDRAIGCAIEGLCKKFPVLDRCEGDWAAEYMMRTYNESHNRTIRERREAEGGFVQQQAFDDVTG